jgi:hypothetical protein
VGEEFAIDDTLARPEPEQERGVEETSGLIDPNRIADACWVTV